MSPLGMSFNYSSVGTPVSNPVNWNVAPTPKKGSAAPQTNQGPPVEKQQYFVEKGKPQFLTLHGTIIKM